MSDASRHWPFAVPLPQRFATNFRVYRDRGGSANPRDDVQGFASSGDHSDLGRFVAFTLAFDQIAKEGIAGDVAELGVYRGYTAQPLATFARRLNRKTYLFDTFEGFDAADFIGLDQGVAPGFKDTSIEAVRSFVGTDQTIYCQGHFPGTASAIPQATTFCLVHIDCDLYAPLLSALEFFYPRMEPGGFIVVHDYSSLAWGGAERATDIFFADKPECIIPMPDSCGTAMVRRQRVSNGLTWRDMATVEIFSTDWHNAGLSRLDPLFAEGWGNGEGWGRWGLGEAHTLQIALPPAISGKIVLELDCRAVIEGHQTIQKVEIFVGAELLQTFVFSAAENNATRRLIIPEALWKASAKASRIEIVFRPANVASPAELSPGHDDTRPLGMALMRLRARCAP